MAQEIIVYRNPGEKLFWDWAMNSDVLGIASTILVYGCAIALVVTIGYTIWASIPKRYVWRAKK